MDLVISKHYSCAGSPVTCVSILSEQVGLLGLIVLFRMDKEYVGVSVVLVHCTGRVSEKIYPVRDGVRFFLQKKSSSRVQIFKQFGVYSRMQ